jgi:hypothetical protein
MKANSLVLLGAGGRTRTGMDLRPEDFESSASTNFTTPARTDVRFYRGTTRGCQRGTRGGIARGGLRRRF